MYSHFVMSMQLSGGDGGIGLNRLCSVNNFAYLVCISDRLLDIRAGKYFFLLSWSGDAQLTACSDDTDLFAAKTDRDVKFSLLRYVA